MFYQVTGVSPEQCSRNSSVIGMLKSWLWSNLNVMESRPTEHAGNSGSTTGGTAIVSGWFQNEYWQKTKLDSDNGKPLACFIVTCKQIAHHVDKQATQIRDCQAQGWSALCTVILNTAQCWILKEVCSVNKSSLCSYVFISVDKIDAATNQLASWKRLVVEYSKLM